MTGLNLIWGAADIAAVLNVPTKTAFRLLQRGDVPARKVGSQWVAEQEKLREFFTGENA